MSGVPGETNDNPSAIAPGDAINFPSPAINPYGTIQRVPGSSTQFTLPADSIFEIIFQVVVSNTGSLVILLNSTELLYSVVGKPGSGSIVGTTIISTAAGTPSILSINNPSSASSSINVDEATGALTEPLSCHLIIKQLK